MCGRARPQLDSCSLLAVCSSLCSVPFYDDDDAALFVLKYEASEEATTIKSEKTPTSREVSEFDTDSACTPGEFGVPEVPPEPGRAEKVASNFGLLIFVVRPPF